MTTHVEKIARKLGTDSRRVFRRIGSWLDPIEREFKHVWPQIDTIEGFLFSPTQERWCFEMAKRLADGATIVEIGSYKGRSTCSFAFGCRGSRKHLYAIDTFGSNPAFWEGDWCKGDFLPVFKRNVDLCGLSEYVTPIRGSSLEIVKGWKQPIDLLFIDGCHDYEHVLAEFLLYSDHVKRGGIIAFHDVKNGDATTGWDGPLRVWNEIAMPNLIKPGRCSNIAFGSKPALWKLSH